MAESRIGIIGLGEMGKPIATNILKAGFVPTVYDVREGPVNELISLGAKTATSPREVASASDIIISMVRDTRTTDLIMFGSDGVWDSIRKDSIIIIMSTIDATYCQQLAERAMKKSVHVLDAPVSGGKVGAEAGTLSIMVGGEKDIFEKCLPLFKAIGTKFYYQGESGMGEVTKIANNLVFMVNIAAFSEALKLAEDCGIEVERFLEIVKNSTGDSWVARHWDIIAAQKKDYREGKGGSMEIVYKDLRLALDLAGSSHTNIPLAALASQLDI